MTDVLKLGRRVHPRVLQQDLLAARVLEIRHIIHLVVDEEPARLLRTVVEDLVQVRELLALGTSFLGLL